jgi:hypothetical protein
MVSVMQILGDQIPLKRNIRTSLRLHRVLWLVLVLTSFLDFVTTVLFMWHDGIQSEGNVVVRWLASTIGVIPGVFMGKSFQIIAAVGFSSLSLSLSRAVLLLMLLLNVVAVVGNLL